MRSILTLSVLIIFCASADAATVRHYRPVQQRVRPEHATTAPEVRKRFAVPGWTDEQTEKWLDDATREVGVGG